MIRSIKPVVTLAAVFLFSVLLTNCSSLSNETGNASSPFRVLQQVNDEPLHLAFIYQQRSELEPCGCSMHPIGGFARAYNALDNWKKAFKGPLFTVGAGAMFVEQPELFDSSKIEGYVRKAGFMLEGLNSFNTAVIGLTVDDFALGETSLKKLARTAHFPFIGTNLYSANGKDRVFPPTFEMSSNGAKVVFLALSDIAPTEIEKIISVKVLPPAQVLRELAVKYRDGKSVVVALNNLKEEDRGALRKEFPWINVWMGGNNNELNGWLPVTQNNAYSFDLSSSDRMRFLSFLDLQIKPGAPWYNQRLTENLKNERKISRKTIAQAKKRLRNKKLEKFERDGIENDMKAAQLQLKNSESLVTLRPETSAVFNFNNTQLTAFYDEPAINPGSKLMDKYHAETHDLALQKGEE